MNRKQYVLTVALSMIAGMAGGVLASQLFMGTPLFPWKTPLEVETIRAERFEVVDKNGTMRAVLGLGNDGVLALSLNDQNGQNRAAFGLLGGKPLLALFAQNGKVIWHVP